MGQVKKIKKYKEVFNDMNFNSNLNNVIISSEQVETFAYNIFRDIGEYLKNHNFEYWEWGIENKIINKIVATVDNGIVEKEMNYKYKLCQYHKSNMKEVIKWT